MTGAPVGLSAQIAAVDAARRIVTGSSRVPSRAAERDLLAEHLAAAHAALCWLRAHEFDIRAAVERKKEGGAP